MKKFTALVDTGGIDAQNSRLSVHALRDLVAMANSPAGVWISLNFDELRPRIGFVHSAYLSGRGVEVEGELDESKLPNPGAAWFVVPGATIGKMTKEGGVTVYDDISHIRFAVTDRASDPYLTPLKWRDE